MTATADETDRSTVEQPADRLDELEEPVGPDETTGPIGWTVFENEIEKNRREKRFRECLPLLESQPDGRKTTRRKRDTIPAKISKLTGGVFGTTTVHCYIDIVVVVVGMQQCQCNSGQ